LKPAKPVPEKSLPDRAFLRELRHMVEDFNCDYADTLDRGEIEKWPDFFTDDGVYRLMARDNAEANLPLALMYCDGKGMLKDRAYAIAHTEMFAPRYTMHQIAQVRVLGVEGEIVTAQANYVIYETLIDEPTHLLQCGKYNDEFLLQGDRLLLKQRNCVYDTLLIPTCIVFPP
jgi:anthranilate 1,2-dioxygenase small subunit